MRNSIISVIITTIIIAPLTRILDIYLAGPEDHKSLMTWILIVFTASSSGIFAHWLLRLIKSSWIMNDIKTKCVHEPSSVDLKIGDTFVKDNGDIWTYEHHVCIKCGEFYK